MDTTFDFISSTAQPVAKHVETVTSVVLWLTTVLPSLVLAVPAVVADVTAASVGL